MKKTKLSTDRRPLTSRHRWWARCLCTLLAKKGVTPNAISFASVIVSVVGFICLWLSFGHQGIQLAILLFCGAIACQLRLLCNLMDGMVAIEAGKQSLDGELWNEFPDRLSDIALFVGVGVAAGSASLGWGVAALAILVSYIRELIKNIMGVADFSGPMAKPHRMALMTIALLIASLIALFQPPPNTLIQPKSILAFGLWISALGSVITVCRRIKNFYQRDRA